MNTLITSINDISEGDIIKYHNTTYIIVGKNVYEDSIYMIPESELDDFEERKLVSTSKTLSKISSSDLDDDFYYLVDKEVWSGCIHPFLLFTSKNRRVKNNGKRQ